VREKTFHEMPVEENDDFLGGVGEEFNSFKEVQMFGERSIRSMVQMFKSSSPRIILIHRNQTFTQSYAAK
jgi:hypothetical protein